MTGRHIILWMKSSFCVHSISILNNVVKKDCGRNIAEKGFKYVVESYIYVYVGRVAKGSELRIRIVKQ